MINAGTLMEEYRKMDSLLAIPDSLIVLSITICFTPWNRFKNWFRKC